MSLLVFLILWLLLLNLFFNLVKHIHVFAEKVVDCLFVIVKHAKDKEDKKNDI